MSCQRSSTTCRPHGNRIACSSRYASATHIAWLPAPISRRHHFSSQQPSHGSRTTFEMNHLFGMGTIGAPRQVRPADPAHQIQYSTATAPTTAGGTYCCHWSAVLLVAPPYRPSAGNSRSSEQHPLTPSTRGDFQESPSAMRV